MAHLVQPLLGALSQPAHHHGKQCDWSAVGVNTAGIRWSTATTSTQCLAVLARRIAPAGLRVAVVRERDRVVEGGVGGRDEAEGPGGLHDPLERELDALACIEYGAHAGETQSVTDHELISMTQQQRQRRQRQRVSAPHNQQSAHA
jgi:hypothetical protein